MSYNYAKLRATVVAATSGPWEADIESGTSRTVRQADGGRGICTTFVQGQPKTPAGWESQRHQNNANSEYIAACDPETIRTLLGERDAQEAEIERLRQPWVSVAERLPEPSVTVFVYSPPQPDDWPGSVRIEFDAIDPESDGESWVNHSAHYEHFCCVAKGGMDVPMTGPSEKAPYTHWMPVPAIPAALSGEPT